MLLFTHIFQVINVMAKLCKIVVRVSSTAAFGLCTGVAIVPSCFSSHVTERIDVNGSL